MKIYREVKVSDRLPITNGYYFTSLGILGFVNCRNQFVDDKGLNMYHDGMTWLEEIELPSEEEINLEIYKNTFKIKDNHVDQLKIFINFRRGANFILNKILK